jgi:hypothetical protein
MRETQSITVNEDERMIPVWSIVVAFAAFVLVEYYFWLVLPKHWPHDQAPLGFRLYFNISWGILTALYFLMVGYVSKDAPRRAMSLRFWMLACFVMPGGIGAVLRHAGGRRLPLLPAVQLPAHGQLRPLLPHGAGYGPVLHALRA